MFRQLAVGLCVLAAAACVRAESRVIADYYPVALGSQWHYKTTTTVNLMNDFSIEGTLTLKIDKLDKGERGVTVRITPEPKAASETVLISEAGLFRINAGENKVEPPLRLLRAPLKDGDTWKTTYEVSTVKGVPVTESAVVALEKVKVPAGEYDAIRVHRKVSFVLLRKTTQQITTWYAPGIGMVKQQLDNGAELSVVTELEKYEPAK